VIVCGPEVGDQKTQSVAPAQSPSDEGVLYVFLDGVYPKMRVGKRKPEAVLVAHGITTDGRRALQGVIVGGRESEDSWKSAGYVRRPWSSTTATPCLTRIGRQCKMPPNSGLKWVASILPLH